MMKSFTIASTAIFMLISICACTLSFTNVSTHGTASDVVDEAQSPENSVQIPISPK